MVIKHTDFVINADNCKYIKTNTRSCSRRYIDLGGFIDIYEGDITSIMQALKNTISNDDAWIVLNDNYFVNLRFVNAVSINNCGDRRWKINYEDSIDYTTIDAGSDQNLLTDIQRKIAYISK